MLSEDNIERINDQIKNRLRDLRFARQSEKSGIIAEIAQMKSLLTEQPSPEEIVAQTIQTLADASKPRISQTDPTISDLLTRLFR